MSKLFFHPDVSHEIKESYIWYQEMAEGLGDNFINELEAAYQTIIELPNTWPKFQKEFRRFLLSSFPFSIIYKFEDNTIFIVAVMHNSRKPGYWKKRT